MSTWTLIYSRQAQKDARQIARAGLRAKTEQLLAILADDPFHTPPRYELLTGNLKGLYSRRISYQHRIVYDLDESKKTVHILRMWTHYDLP